MPLVLTFHALGKVRRLHQGADDGFPLGLKIGPLVLLCNGALNFRNERATAIGVRHHGDSLSGADIGLKIALETLV